MVPSLSLIVLLTDPPLIATIRLKPVNREGYTTRYQQHSRLLELQGCINNEDFRDKWKDTRPELDGRWYGDTRPILMVDGIVKPDLS